MSTPAAVPAVKQIKPKGKRFAVHTGNQVDALRQKRCAPKTISNTAWGTKVIEGKNMYFE